MKAKSLSLWAQLIGALWIAVWSGYKFLHEMPTVQQIVASGIFIAGCFSPVYFNLIMEKVTGKMKPADEPENT